MAQRPQTLIRQSVVVALLFGGRQPNSAQRIGGILGRHAHSIVTVDRLAIGRATAVCHPGAGAGAHDRLKCRDHAAGRYLHLDLSAFAELMRIRFAIGNHHDLRRMQLFAHHLLQCLRGPVLAIIDFNALTLLHFAQHLPHLRENRQRQPPGLRVAKKTPAADIAQQNIGPAPQQQPGAERQKQRHDQHRDGCKRNQVIARGVLPTIDETQVVHDRHAIWREPGRALVKH